MTIKDEIFEKKNSQQKINKTECLLMCKLITYTNSFVQLNYYFKVATSTKLY